MSDYLPKFTGDQFTITATGDLVGGRLVTAVGAHAGDTALNAIGVAAHDTATGKPCTIYALSSGVHRLTASGAVTAGALLVADTGGKVKALAAVTTPTAGDVTGTRAIVGVAMTAATGADDIILVKG